MAARNNGNGLTAVASLARRQANFHKARGIFNAHGVLHVERSQNTAKFCYRFSRSFCSSLLNLVSRAATTGNSATRACRARGAPTISVARAIGNLRAEDAHENPRNWHCIAPSLLAPCCSLAYLVLASGAAGAVAALDIRRGRASRNEKLTRGACQKKKKALNNNRRDIVRTL